jgi:hypothetical protein
LILISSLQYPYQHDSEHSSDIPDCIQYNPGMLVPFPGSNNNDSNETPEQIPKKEFQLAEENE